MVFQSDHSAKVYTWQSFLHYENILSICSFLKGLIIQKANSKLLGDGDSGQQEP